MVSLRLLSTNRKLQKSMDLFGGQIVTAGLFLAPHRRSGTNVCPEAGICSTVCNLWFSGRTVTQPVRAAMLRRTSLLVTDPSRFEQLLCRDIELLLRRAEKQGKRLFLRLNGASDLDFSRFATWFPTVEFYDYTKVARRVQFVLDGTWPPNYSLCYSFNERSDWKLCRRYLRKGGTVSVVFDSAYHPQSGKIGKLPRKFCRFPVVDGDLHDLRHPEFDGRGVVVGLRFKGTRRLLARAVRRGFVVSTS